MISFLAVFLIFISSFGLRSLSKDVKLDHAKRLDVSMTASMTASFAGATEAFRRFTESMGGPREPPRWEPAPKPPRLSPLIYRSPEGIHLTGVQVENLRAQFQVVWPDRHIVMLEHGATLEPLAPDVSHREDRLLGSNHIVGTLRQKWNHLPGDMPEITPVYFDGKPTQPQYVDCDGETIGFRYPGTLSDSARKTIMRELQAAFPGMCVVIHEWNTMAEQVVGPSPITNLYVAGGTVTLRGGDE